MRLDERSNDFHTVSLDEMELEPITERAPATGRARIVVADDDHAMRSEVCSALQLNGYEVRAASSGWAFLTALHSIEEGFDPMDGVDLVVLDNKMPGMTGLEALRMMRALSRRIPAVLMTAYPSPRVEDEAACLDAVVLPKPFGRVELGQVVLSLLLGRGRGNG